MTSVTRRPGLSVTGALDRASETTPTPKTQQHHKEPSYNYETDQTTHDSPSPTTAGGTEPSQSPAPCPLQSLNGDDDHR